MQLPNGEKDGGLWVMRGSAALFPELVEAFDLRSVRPFQNACACQTLMSQEQQCSGRDFFKYKPEHIEWLKEHGCEWVHPNLEPGDVVFWDSREAHTAEAPEAGRPRMAVCERTIRILASRCSTHASLFDASRRLLQAS